MTKYYRELSIKGTVVSFEEINITKYDLEQSVLVDYLKQENCFSTFENGTSRKIISYYDEITTISYFKVSFISPN